MAENKLNCVFLTVTTHTIVEQATNRAHNDIIKKERKKLDAKRANEKAGTRFYPILLVIVVIFYNFCSCYNGENRFQIEINRFLNRKAAVIYRFNMYHSQPQLGFYGSFLVFIFFHLLLPVMHAVAVSVVHDNKRSPLCC